MNSLAKFGVQSFCFREFTDNAVVAEKVCELGLDQIELCGIHADFSQPESLRQIAEIYRAAGVSIVSIGVQTFIGHDSEKKWFESAILAGARHISCHFQINTFLSAIPKVRRWAREFGIKVGIHCHGGWMFGGQPDVMDYLIELGGPEIGVCIDTAWARQIGPGDDAIKWANRFAGSIYGVHLKDFVYDSEGRWKDVIVGTGTLNLPGFVAALRSQTFSGMSVLEYEGNPMDPVPALKECITSMQKAVSSC